MGDFVVVTNAEKVKVTGQKKGKKILPPPHLYLGGLVEQPYDEVIERHPDRVILLAVRRMLPKTTLGKHLFPPAVRSTPGRSTPTRPRTRDDRCRTSRREGVR